MKKIIFIIFVIFSLNLYSRVGFKESTIIEKKDYGYIVYAEDYYRLYSLPSYYSEYDMLKNVDYLERALKSPFDFVNRALTIIESEESYTRYKDLMHMQFNYLITQNYIYIAGLYDKENYYFYNSQFDEDIKKSFEYAIYFYNLAKERWIIKKDLAQKVMLNKSKLEMDNLIDKAYKIALGEIDYNKTADRQLKHIENILEKNPAEHLFIKRNDTFISKKEKNIENDFKPIRVGIINKGGQGERIYSPKGHAITLSAYGGGAGARTGLYYTEDRRVRRLSINECKKIMGFSTNHVVSEGIQGYQQLGNAVIPNMIGYIWKNLRIS